MEGEKLPGKGNVSPLESLPSDDGDGEVEAGADGEAVGDVEADEKNPDTPLLLSKGASMKRLVDENE